MAFLFAPAKMMVIGANLEENNLSHLVVAKWRWDTILVSRAGVGQGFDVSNVPYDNEAFISIRGRPLL
jgi:hypothetical protein